jgi:hypothetical protein
VGEEVPDGLLELILPQLVGRWKTKRLRKPLDLRCIPIAVVELAQRHLLRELALGHSRHGTRTGDVETGFFERSNRSKMIDAG